MRALIQRVSSANVSNENHETHSISHGLVVLLGVGPEDTTAIAEKLMTKISKLRIFEDETGKTNRSIQDVQGSILLVSQFTLYADCRKGNRPSFTKGQSHKVALLQISSDECCFLFRLNMTGLTQPLVDLLENPAVIKVGLSLKDDFMMPVSYTHLTLPTT